MIMILTIGENTLFSQMNIFTKKDTLCLSDEPVAIGESPILKNDNFSKKKFKIELDLNTLPKHGKAEIKRINPEDLPSFISTTFFDTVTIRYEYQQSAFKMDSVRYIITDFENNGLKSSSWLIFDIGCKSGSDPLLVKCDQDKIVSTDPNTCQYTYETKAPQYTPGQYNPAMKGTAIGEIKSLNIGDHDRISVFAGIYNGNIIDICETYVVVKDLQKPKIICPNDIFSCVPKVNFNQPIVSDNCSLKSFVQIEGPVSGSNFPLGITKISFLATDINLNEEFCSFNVEVANLSDISWKDPNEKDTLCTSDAPIFLNSKLTNVLPGTWTNASNTSEFNPQNITPNSTVTISFTVNQLNCSKSIDREIFVIAPANINISPIEREICQYSEPFNLNIYNTNNSSGNWYLDNQLITNVLNPKNISLGQHQISFRGQSNVCPKEFKQNININTGSQIQNIEIEFCGLIGSQNHFQEIDVVIDKSDALQYQLNDNTLSFTSSDYEKKQVTFIDLDKLTCQSLIKYNLTFHKAPSKSYAGEDLSLNYQKSNISLNANTPSIGKGKWITSSNSVKIEDIYSPNSLITTETGRSELIWEISNGNCKNETDTLIVSKISLGVPNAFSPNSDGKNDYFTITGLKNLGNIHFCVYNRWGQNVYESLNFDNNWDGKDSKGNLLPNDTYYFDVRFDTDQIIKGKITLRW